MDRETRPGAAEDAAPGAQAVKRIWGRRWTICALLFFATTVNYIDRQVIGVLKPTLAAELGWSEIDYSNIVFAFTFAYAIGLILVGRMMDWLGTRRGFSISIVVWSVAAMAHALVRTVGGFSAARFALGLGESGNFPAAIKTVAEWFPKKERALATGIFNAGSNVGAVITPVVVPWITITYGWEWAFIATGALGFIWLAFWLALYHRPEEHPTVTAEELAHIRSDPPETTVRIRWRDLFPHRQTWAFAIGKFMTDPIWWVYLYWVPDFLNKNHGITPHHHRPSAGGHLRHRGHREHRRGMDLLAPDPEGVERERGPEDRHADLRDRASCRSCSCRRCTISGSPWRSWGWRRRRTRDGRRTSSRRRRTCSPGGRWRRSSGSAGWPGPSGGMLVAKAVGYILEWTGSYVIIFIIAGAAYLLALLVIHLIVPTLEQSSVGEST